MKQDRFGHAGVLSPDQIHLLFTEGLKTSRDIALFGTCLYTACRISEACKLLTSDVIDANGPRIAVLFRRMHTKGQRDTREVAMHEQLTQYLVAYQPNFNKDISSPVGMAALIYE